MRISLRLGLEFSRRNLVVFMVWIMPRELWEALKNRFNKKNKPAPKEPV